MNVCWELTPAILENSGRSFRPEDIRSSKCYKLSEDHTRPSGEEQNEVCTPAHWPAWNIAIAHPSAFTVSMVMTDQCLHFESCSTETGMVARLPLFLGPPEQKHRSVWAHGKAKSPFQARSLSSLRGGGVWVIWWAIVQHVFHVNIGNLTTTQTWLDLCCAQKRKAEN